MAGGRNRRRAHVRRERDAHQWFIYELGTLAGLVVDDGTLLQRPCALVFSSFAVCVTGARNSCALIEGATVSGDSSTLASRTGTEIERQRLCMMD